MTTNTTTTSTPILARPAKSAQRHLGWVTPAQLGNLALSQFRPNLEAAMLAASSGQHGRVLWDADFLSAEFTNRTRTRVRLVALHETEFGFVPTIVGRAKRTPEGWVRV